MLQGLYAVSRKIPPIAVKIFVGFIVHVLLHAAADLDNLVQESKTKQVCVCKRVVEM